MSIHLTDSQKELLNKLVAFQEEVGTIYPFYCYRGTDGTGFAHSLQGFSYDFNDLLTLGDLGFLIEEHEDKYRITRKGYDVLSVGLTESAKEALRKLVIYKEKGASYPFFFLGSPPGICVEQFSPDLSFKIIDIERLIDFRLLRRGQDGYRITKEGYEAIKSNFGSLNPISYDPETEREFLSQLNRNLDKLRLQAAQYGSLIFAPLILQNQIEAIENEIAISKAKLDGLSAEKQELTKDTLDVAHTEKIFDTSLRPHEAFIITDRNFDENSDPQEISIHFTNKGSSVIIVKEIKCTSVGKIFNDTSLRGFYQREPEKGRYVIKFDKRKSRVPRGKEFVVHVNLSQKWQRKDIDLHWGDLGLLFIDMIYNDKLEKSVLYKP